MKKLIVLSFVILALVVTSCDFPFIENILDRTPEDPDDILATEIAEVLTGTPVDETPTLREITPTQEPTLTDTPESIDTPTNTPEPIDTPTDTPEPAETPTDTPEPIDTPTDTPEPTDTPPPAPTPTLVDTDPAIVLGTPDWVDNMVSGGNWATGFSELTSIRFEDGYLKMTSTSDLIGWRLSWPVLEDFYLESTVLSPNCSGWDEFGMVFRAPASLGAEKVYLFGITCNGRYSLRRWDGDNLHVIINWQQDDNILSGANSINRLGIMAQDSNIGLYINGNHVNQAVDSAYLSGQIGVFVGSHDVEKVEVWMEQIRYWDNP